MSQGRPAAFGCQTFVLKSMQFRLAKYLIVPGNNNCELEHLKKTFDVFFLYPKQCPPPSRKGTFLPSAFCSSAQSQFATVSF